MQNGKLSLFGLFLVAASSALAGPISLDPAKFKHITFEDITPTIYAKDGTALKMTVKSSSSLFLMPFETVTNVSKIKFKWKSEGTLKVSSAKAEETKDGDDGRLRIALIISGDAPTVPFFAPGWVKAIRDSMKLPGDEITYIAVGSNHKPGSVWENPYSDSMKMLSVASASGEEFGP